MATKTISITQKKDNPIPKEVLATEICHLSDNVNKLILSGLNENAVIALLKDATGIPKTKIKAVLTGLSELRANYTHD